MKPPPDVEPPPALRLELLLETDDDAALDDDRWGPDAAFLRDWAVHALGGVPAVDAGADDASPTRHELSVRIVGPETMRALNRDWRGKDAPTNVLSFPSDLPALPMAGMEAEDDDAGALLVLGDLVLCPAVIDAEAAAQDKFPSAHWAHLIVHGVLHLCGLDHEDEASAAAMEGLEIRLLSSRDLPDPYGEHAACP